MSLKDRVVPVTRAALFQFVNQGKASQTFGDLHKAVHAAGLNASVDAAAVVANAYDEGRPVPEGLQLCELGRDFLVPFARLLSRNQNGADHVLSPDEKRIFIYGEKYLNKAVPV